MSIRQKVKHLRISVENMQIVTKMINSSEVTTSMFRVLKGMHRSWHANQLALTYPGVLSFSARVVNTNVPPWVSHLPV